MSTINTHLAGELRNTSSRLFISRYSSLFNKFLAGLSNPTKEIIKRNKELNDLYDLFLDFIIDSSQHLDYNDAKEQEKNVGSN